jgi:hypothetical protein
MDSCIWIFWTTIKESKEGTKADGLDEVQRKMFQTEAVKLFKWGAA